MIFVQIFLQTWTPPPWAWVLSKFLFNNDGCPPPSPWIAFKHAKLWHGFPILGSKHDPPCSSSFRGTDIYSNLCDTYIHIPPGGIITPPAPTPTCQLPILVQDMELLDDATKRSYANRTQGSALTKYEARCLSPPPFNAQFSSPPPAAAGPIGGAPCQTSTSFGTGNFGASHRTNGRGPPTPQPGSYI